MWVEQESEANFTNYHKVTQHDTLAHPSFLLHRLLAKKNFEFMVFFVFWIR